MEIDFPREEEPILRGRVCATRRKDSNANLLRRTHDLPGIDSRTAGSTASSFKENSRHHSFVFVIEKMAMKDGHALDHGVGEVHDDVDGTAVRNIHGIQPQWVADRQAIFGVGQEMNLMYMHGMQFPCGIDDFPMLICSDPCAHHRSGIERELFSVDVKTFLVFRECHDESRRRFFFGREIQRFEIRFERARRSSGR